MTDLSYHKELVSHYRGVKARLWKPKLPVRHVLTPAKPPALAAPQKPRKSLRLAIMTMRESCLSDAYSLTDVMAAVSTVTGISLREMTSPRRTSPIASARQLYFWVARNYTAQSQAKIARQANLSVPSSVYHAINKIEADKTRWQPRIDAVLNLLGEQK